MHLTPPGSSASTLIGNKVSPRQRVVCHGESSEKGLKVKLPALVFFAVCAVFFLLNSVASRAARSDLQFAAAKVLESKVLQANLECKLKNGKLVCGESKKNKKAPAAEGGAGGAPNDNGNAAAPEGVEGKVGGEEDGGETASPDGYVAHATYRSLCRQVQACGWLLSQGHGRDAT